MTTSAALTHPTTTTTAEISKTFIVQAPLSNHACSFWLPRLNSERRLGQRDQNQWDQRP